MRTPPRGRTQRQQTNRARKEKQEKLKRKSHRKATLSCSARNAASSCRRRGSHFCPASISFPVPHQPACQQHALCVCVCVCVCVWQYSLCMMSLTCVVRPVWCAISAVSVYAMPVNARLRAVSKRVTCIRLSYLNELLPVPWSLREVNSLRVNSPHATAKTKAVRHQTQADSCLQDPA